MKRFSFVIILFCFVILLSTADQAQTNHATKKSNAKDDWTPPEVGCKRYVVERKLRLPRNIKEVFIYLSFRLRGRNKVKGYEYGCLPVIDNFDLDKTEVIIRSHQNSQQSENLVLVKVSIKAHDLDGDEFLYYYSVSGGKIIGTGANVVWDLSGVPPGNHKISVLLDDGCGVCQEPTIKEIKVLESAN